MKNFKILAFTFFALFSNISKAESDFKVYIPGTNEPVIANINNENYVTFISYPKIFKGKMNISNTSIGVFYPAGITKENCAQVESRARNAVNTMFPEHIRNSQKTMVRKYSTVNIYLNSGINFQLPEFEKKVKEEAAKIQNVDIYQIQLDNNMSIEKINYTIEYDINSLSNIIGNKNEFEEQTHLFLGQPLFATGSINVSNSLSDLVCDFYLGKAKLKMNFYGKFGKQESSYQVLEAGDISLVYKNIMLRSKEYFDVSTVNAKLRNLALSSIYLKEALDNIGGKKFDNNVFIFVFERIISPETGKVIPNLSDEKLYKLMQAHKTNSKPYAAEVIYDYNQ